MSDSIGDAAQTRAVAEQVAEAAIDLYTRRHPEIITPQIPAPLKWAGGIIAALFTASVAAMAMWLVTSVSEMQVTLARMDERMANSSVNSTARLDAHEVRLGALEAAMKEAHR